MVLIIGFDLPDSLDIFNGDLTAICCDETTQAAFSKLRFIRDLSPELRSLTNGLDQQYIVKRQFLKYKSVKPCRTMQETVRSIVKGQLPLPFTISPSSLNWRLCCRDLCDALALPLQQSNQSNC